MFSGLVEAMGLVIDVKSQPPGVRLVVEAALQSPQFIYRTELNATTGSDGRIALDSWETAARLSYLAWNSMPDAELFDLAANDRLKNEAEVEAAMRRLLDDPRALPKLISFHEQAWHFARFSKIAPDRDTYPAAPPDIVNPPPMARSAGA